MANRDDQNNDPAAAARADAVTNVADKPQDQCWPFDSDCRESGFEAAASPSHLHGIFEGVRVTMTPAVDGFLERRLCSLGLGR
jgi:hypothetical protein